MVLGMEGLAVTHGGVGFHTSTQPTFILYLIYLIPTTQLSLCRDLNAAINIKARGTHALKAQSMSS